MGCERNPSDIPIRIVGISGSPRKGGNTALMINAALEAAREAAPQAETICVELAGKNIKPCLGCNGCRKTGECIIKDDYAGIADEYLKADALLLGSPVYHMGITGQLKCFLDRLGNAALCKYDLKMPRHMKVGGAIAQGANRFGGQEFTESMIINSLLLMNCMPVAGDIPHCYLGACGSTYGKGDKDAILSNEAAMASARNLGKRVAEATLVIKVGMQQLTGFLPAEYRAL